jgi:hypothetical protein
MSDFKAKAYSPDLSATVRYYAGSVADKYGKFTVVLSNLSDAAAKALEDLGITVREDGTEAEIRGKWIKVSHSNPINLKFAEGLEDPGYAPPNGSLATVCLFPYSGTSKITPKLASITITELAEKYEGGADKDPL